MQHFPTTQVNKWWDSLKHEQKEELCKNICSFHWGRPIKVYTVNRGQKLIMYNQYHGTYQKPQSDTFLNYGTWW